MPRPVPAIVIVASWPPRYSTHRELPHDARTDHHAAGTSPRPRNRVRDAGSGAVQGLARGLCRESGPRDALFRERGDGGGPAALLRFRPIDRPALPHEPLQGRPRGGGRTNPRNPAPPGRTRTGRPPGPPDDRPGVPDAGSPRGLVARPRFADAGRDRGAPRRGAGLSAGSQPPVAIRRPRDPPPGREQAE